MAEKEYTVVAPDGKEITLIGPVGASQEEVIAQAQKLYQPSKVESQPVKQVNQQQFAEGAGGAAFGRPMRNVQLNIQEQPRPLESALAGATKSAVVDPILGLTRLLTGGKVGAESAKKYAEEAKPYQETNPGSYLTGQIGGSLVPASATMKGMSMIPSFAASPLAQSVATGTALGALTPEETGKTGSNFYKEQAKQAGLGGVIGAVPTGISKTGEYLGSLLRKEAGLATGAGEEAFKQAYQAGKQGNEVLLQNMRGQVPMEDVLNQAKESLGNMRQAKNQLYRSGMKDISKDKTILNFNNIDQSLKEVENIGSYQGKITNPNAIKALQEVKTAVNEWKNADPAVFHTPEGMDALKQRIGSIIEDIPFGTKARTLAENLYHSVKNTITDQAPVYSKVMKDYSEQADLIREIEKSLSLGQKATTAQGLNKLQSLMRNNVNTNYGYRQELANKLMEQGGGDLMPALAGQSLSSATPRGLVGQGIDAGALLGILGGGLSHLPGTVAVMATTSPRLMGEAAYKLGQVAGKVPELTQQQKNLAKLLMMESIQQGAK
jgi:hypothetical protein